MAHPTILINSAGSNTAASGSGPATALFGTAAATAASTVVTLLVDNPDLSGVATDGSAAIWIASSSGIRWSEISAKDNTPGVKTVTVVTAYANTESGKSWGIGGKRATMAGSPQLFNADWKSGWTVDVQTGETFTSALAIQVTGSSETSSLPVTIYSSAVSRPLLTTATNSINIFNVFGDCVQFRHLAFSNTAGTKGTAGSTGNAITPAGGGLNGLSVDDCTFDGFVSAIMVDNVTNSGTNHLSLTEVEIKNSTSKAISAQFNSAGDGFIHMDHCNIHDNVGAGLSLQNSSGVLMCSFCEFNINSKGITTVATGTQNNIIISVINSTFRDNTGAGIDMPGSGYCLIVHDSAFDTNGDYGIKLTATQATYNSQRNPPLLFRNAFRNNTTGTIANGPPTWADITPSSSPFNSSSDSGLNSTAGAGTALKGAASVAPNASANTPGDIGAIPSGGGSAGGSTGGVSKLAGMGGLAA